MSRRRTTAATGLLVLAVAVGACDAGADEDARGGGDPPATTGAAGASVEVDPAALAALPDEEPGTDSVYPDYGNEIVDAQHYGLDLAWDPTQDLLTAQESLTFRATQDADRIPLDLSDQLEITSLTVDGDDADFTLEGTDLLIDHAVRADQRYVVDLAYTGTPEPVPAPTQRGDFAQGVGWVITDEHRTWTLQEPFGGFTWYAVNDHPSDKALYDFALTVPSPWTGVANGENTATTEEDGKRTSVWHLAEPASSYLVTVAFDDFQVTDLESESGVPIQIWAARDGDATPGDTETAPDAMAWLENLLGPYPFDTFGIVVIDGESGMETQTMVTLGDTEYSTGADVVVHELAHHWYGDTVTPSDWRDVWMNEGMAMYLQLMWQAEQTGLSTADQIDQVAGYERQLRKQSGPPGDWDPDNFGDGNIYFGPAVMWQELREKIGDDAFFDLIRAWPQEQENRTASREEYIAWIEDRTGEELSAFFDSWLTSPKTPARS